MIEVTRQEREWLLGNLASGLVEYLGVTQLPVPVEELLAHPPALYQHDLGVAEVTSGGFDAAFVRFQDKHGQTLVRAGLPPERRRRALARELFFALVTSEHGRALGLHDMLQDDLEASAEYFARSLLAGARPGEPELAAGSIAAEALMTAGPVPPVPPPGVSDAFQRLMARFGRYFARSEARQQATKYVQALLAPVAEKNCWQLAQAVGDEDPQGMQRLLFGARWDEEAVRDELQRFVIDSLGEASGIALLGETSLLRKGLKSVGTSRQLVPSTGRLETCQIGVFLGYSTAKGHTLLDRRLYLPEDWATDELRRAEAKVPEAVDYRSRAELGQEMLQHAWGLGVPFTWVVGEEAYGDSQDLREAISAAGRLFVLSVSGPTRVARALPSEAAPESAARDLSGGGGREPRPALGGTVSALVSEWSERNWARLVTSRGEGQAIAYDWGRARVIDRRRGRPGVEAWLLARRSINQRSQIKYYLSNAPIDTPLSTLSQAAGASDTLEQILDEARDEAGLASSEVRHWNTWHRHITLAMIAHAWLASLRESAGGDPRFYLHPGA